MQTTSPQLAYRGGEPNVELLRRMGWSVRTLSGDYCAAWRGPEEVVFEWHCDGWHRVGGRGGADEI